MSHALRIGSIRGIPLRIHWTFSLLVVFVLLATPHDPRALANAAGWVVAVFTCIVLHELAHCLVARRRGFTVRDIVLLPIGGVSEIVGFDHATADELPIALAGPGASFLLAAGLLAGAIATHASVLPPTLSTGSLVVRVLWANVLLGSFNLVPAFPLDGGRALRAWLARTHAPSEATQIATRIGVALGYAMLVGGFVVDIFLSVIGLFVIIGSRAEASVVAIRAEIGDLHVGDAAISHPMALSAELSIADAHRVLDTRPGLSVPVVQGEHYLGMVAAHDLGHSGARRLEDVADRATPLLDPAGDLWPDAVAAFRASGRHELAVGSDGRLTAVLHDCDVEALLRRHAFGQSQPIRARR